MKYTHEYSYTVRVSCIAGTAHWARLHVEIKCIPGVLETGLFVGMAHAAFFGSDDGTVHVRRRPSDFVMSEH